MLFLHFLLIVAGKAGRLGGPIRVAPRALAIGISMIHGEIMLELCVIPVVSIVALRALSLEMVLRAVVLVATGTIIPYRTVVEVSVAPIGGIMAG